MPLQLDDNQAMYQIRAYTPGKIQINEAIFTHSLIVTPTQLIEQWTPETPQEITADSLATILTLQPTILLIGTGEKQVFLPLEIYGELINHGIGVEIMDTSAACRTYNVLTAENRNVVAALLV